MIIYLAFFSLISSLCFLLLGAPDVAMAEIVISAFSTIIFIISFEKYYSIVGFSPPVSQKRNIKNNFLPVLFTVSLFFLFIRFIPDYNNDFPLKEQYLSMFVQDVGGENAVTAIYLGYRMYDTLFEALMLFISIAAVVHLSYYQDSPVMLSGKRKDINNSDIAFYTIRIICPLLLMLGAYLIINGHITPGGGFQGGVVLASFFIYRYMIFSIHDIRIGRILIMKKIIYVCIIILAVFFIIYNINTYIQIPNELYLIFMNMFIGMKVACGFLIIFYRFATFEWR
jgi:multicomponent Na+:H+ antiporter subunit B